MKIQRWRIIVLIILFAAPVLFLIGVGSYHLWINSLWFWVWWPLVGCLMVAYYLAYRWQAAKKLLTVDFDGEMHWTDRDKEAWKLVQARAEKATEIQPEKFSDMNFYVDTGKELALELASFYHPGATDPVSSLTIPEILSVIELASHDLGQMVRKNLPAGHLLTINDWKRAQTAVKWYGIGSNVYWAISTIFAPYQTAVRYLASQAGITKPLQMLQQNLLLWFYTAYLQRMGTYLIDLNSGRLRVGAERYRQLMDDLAKKEGTADAATSPEELPVEPPVGEEGLPKHVTITIMGQVKAGKSSLINALLGEQKAETSVLPATDHITRYEINPEGIDHRLQLLDTVGYGHEGPREDQLRETQTAAQQSDLLLLVVHAVNPARHADFEALKKLDQWFDKHPELKMPAVLAVVTHIDLLKPAMEWEPPYNWQKPTRRKEQNIEQAVASVREQLGEYLVGAVPVCSADGKIDGVSEELLPAVSQLLGESRAVALLRCLHAEANEGKFRKVFDQVWSGGKELAKVLWEQATTK